MKQTQLIMGMPITIEVAERNTDAARHLDDTFTYFRAIDARYSTYKQSSEISKINNGLPIDQWSDEMKTVLALCEKTREETGGYFDIRHDNKRDPSGLVKGWAIRRAANRLLRRKVKNFYIEAGGDIQTYGFNENGEPWKIGIRNPFNMSEIIKILAVRSEGVATSGTYIRGDHIYDPLHPGKTIQRVKSLTVIGPNVYEADRFATAAFAMDIAGVSFIQSKPGLEGYMITDDGIATYTSGFERYVVNA
ncbi:MAG TPA: FAD:protein FMN transferase [Verrucomicrobiae bacterium]|nr:FAD:protein FMN transferase [Verrucomicrobiae bacterium]